MRLRPVTMGIAAFIVALALSVLFAATRRAAASAILAHVTEALSSADPTETQVPDCRRIGG